MKPKKKEDTVTGDISLSADKSDKSMLAVMFPGLSIPNDKRRESLSPEPPENEDQKEVDDMMAALESLQPQNQM